ncbi:MAG TPA: dockerin type I domain-containing protein [Candidatus Acidoferrum sp.]|nr:dockerin type I domain-containing protein [Candidatus Acidoferrum sp.]
MKRVLILITLAMLLAGSTYPLPPSRTQLPGPTTAIHDVRSWINANELLMFTGNSGIYAYDAERSLGRFPGLYFPYVGIPAIQNGTANKTVLFAAGLWIGALDSASSDTLVTVADYAPEFTPGHMVDHTFVPGIDTEPAVKVYRIYSDSLQSNPNSDYLNWPADQGAPLDSLGRPAILGDQTTWCVYNDADPSRHLNPSGETQPLGIEVQQTSFAFSETGSLSRTIFLKYKIINKGLRTLDSLYVSLWSDPDLGSSADDLVGCDTTRSLGFCYNGADNDGIYGTKPPAVGYDILQGPIVYTGKIDDTGVVWGLRKVGYRNLGMTSFNKYFNGADPFSYARTYNYMRGLNPDGTPYTFQGAALKYAASGNPVTGTGDVDTSPADRRMMLSTGPLKMRPDDSTEIVAAIIVAQDTSRLASVAKLMYRDWFIQRFWDLGMPSGCCLGTRGDITNDYLVDLSDISAFIDYLFFSGPITTCTMAADVDGSGAVDVTDLQSLVDYLFFGGAIMDCW